MFKVDEGKYISYIYIIVEELKLKCKKCKFNLFKNVWVVSIIILIVVSNFL